MDEKKKTAAPVNAYKRTDVLTANRETILLMMYAGALRFLRSAIDAANRKDISERNRFIAKTQSIVSELRSTLNFKVGGDIAEHLDRLYVFVTECLLNATMEGKVERLEEALKVLEMLNQAWEEAVASLRKEKVQSATQLRKGI